MTQLRPTLYMRYANRPHRERTQQMYTRSFRLSAEYIDLLFAIQDAFRNACGYIVTMSEVAEMSLDALNILLSTDKPVTVQSLKPGERLRPGVRLVADQREAEIPGLKNLAKKKDRIVVLHRAGRSYAAIAAEAGCHVGYVSAALQRHKAGGARPCDRHWLKKRAALREAA